MRLRMLTSLAADRANWVPGDEVEWPDEEDAKRLVAAGYAEDITPPPSTPPAKPSKPSKK